MMAHSIVAAATLTLAVASARAHEDIPEAERVRCHRPKGRRHHADCAAYLSQSSPDRVASRYGTLADECLSVTWQSAVAAGGLADRLGTTGAWGSCTNYTEDDDFRYMISNSVPSFYFNPYCPLGIGYGYCIGEEECVFDGLVCGDNASVGASAGFTPYGDVWVPYLSYYAVTKHPNPTRNDRPGDMYETVAGGDKNIGAATGFVVENGVSIQGPNDAGNYNIDEAGFILACGGHVTPPTDVMSDDSGIEQVAPIYHTHQAPSCVEQFVTTDKTYADGGTQDQHGALFGYALDGFGIHTYTDLAGAAPVLDECGGHFGPTADDGDGAVAYHYHATTYTPYHLACQGPALGQCSSTQHGADFCGAGCGADLCIQPGTNRTELASYLADFNGTWFASWSNNLDW